MSRVPEISVVIPCRDEAEKLTACLEALADQDLPRTRFEVLLVDGSSDERCKLMAVGRGTRLLLDEGRGPSAARNIGIRAARAPIIAFTDADCVPRFDWLTRIMDAFQDPSVAGVAGGMRMPRGTLIGRLEDNDARLHYAGYIGSNIAYRRDMILSVGGFDESLYCAEDYDLAWRILGAGHSIVRVPEAIVLHDQPEVSDGLATYLRKQFWYARADVRTHARCIARGALPGSQLARGALVGALGNSAVVAGALAGLALRSPAVFAAALGPAIADSARSVRRSIREIGEGESIRMSAVETARRLARGVGTLVGIADLAWPSQWAPLTSIARDATRARPSAPLPSP